MKYHLIIILLFVTSSCFSQFTVPRKYINDAANENNYIIFNSDSTFKFRRSIHLMHDISCGTFKTIGDTIFLMYNTDLRDTICNREHINSPTINFGKDSAKCNDDIIRLNAFFEDASYLWNDNSSVSFFDVLKAGTYYCKVSNYCGTASDTIVITDKICECEAITPNVFSPNGDGINDKLIPSINCNPVYFSLFIFNRNGQSIFESTNTNTYWDGKYHGKPVPIGVYYYILKIQGASDINIKQKTGSITLIR